MKEPKVLWFLLSVAHHAFEVREEDGTVDTESCCGTVDIEACADEPARELREFTGRPACLACLAVAQLDLPSP